MRKAEIDRKLDQIIDFSGVERFLDTPVKRYSSGMQVRLAFAVAAHLEPEILIVDEVLAVGDAEFQRKCLGKMGEVAGSGRTVLFVSHNMAAVANLCGRAVLLSAGAVQVDGEVRSVVAEYLSSDRQSAAEVDAASHPSRLPQAIPVIRRFSILNRRGIPDSQVPLGDPVTFRLELESGGFPNASLGIHIYDGVGNRAVTFHTETQMPEPLTLSGAQIVECEVPTLPLVPGPYSVVVGLAAGNSLIDRIDPVLQFEIVPKDILNTGRLPSSRDGAIVLKGRWSVRAPVSERELLAP
jgi:lipopolysaccharide transport system ATP-binding protein